MEIEKVGNQEAKSRLFFKEMTTLHNVLYNHSNSYHLGLFGLFGLQLMDWLPLFVVSTKVSISTDILKITICSYR